MMNPNPTCKNECRFMEVGPSMTTAMYFTPIYDKNGNNINPDGNITSGSLACTVCNMKWYYSTQFGETTFKEIK